MRKEKIGNKKLFTLIMGQSPESKYYNNSKEGLPFFQGKKDFGLKYPTATVWSISGNKIAEKGDLLISVRAPVGAINQAKEQCILGRGLAAIRSNSQEVDNEYLYFFFKNIELQLSKEGSGSTFNSITKDYLEELEVPFFEIAIQKQIVSKIKECFNYLDKAEEKLKIANSNFDKVIDSALVKYIEREGRLNNWDYKEIGKISIINPTKSEIKDNNPETQVSFVQMSSVSDKTGTIEKQETRALREVKKGYTYFKKGDIIFAKITPCMENGKCSLTENLNFDIGFGSTEFHVIRVDRQKVLPEYIYTILRSKKFRRLAMTNMTGTAGQKRLPKEYLSSFKIYVPNKEKQIEITRKLQDLEKERVRYSLVYQSSIKNISLLRQSILKKAFEGKLI